MKKLKVLLKELVKKLFAVKKLFSRFIIIGSLAYMVRVTEKVLSIAEKQSLNFYSIIAAAGAV